MISLHLPVINSELIYSHTIFYFSLLYFLSSVWKVYCHVFTHHRGAAGQAIDDKTNGDQETRPALDSNHPRESSGTRVELPIRQSDYDAIDTSRLCERCRGINIESLCADNGYEFYSTWEEVKRSGEQGCAFCEFIAHCHKFINPDWSISPYGFFNGIYYISDEARARLQKVKPGRLYALKVFDEKKGLVARTEDGTIVYFNLSLVGEFDEDEPGLPEISVRKRLQNTGSDSSFDTARKWIATCNSDHDCLRIQSVASLDRCPARRLIDVEAFGPTCPDARLVETAQAEDTAKYIALSYRWGGVRSYITTHETLRQRMDRIIFTDVPLTFKHAIRATRELGVRYIWIDSLCIIQDDAEDWGIESVKMCDIYGSSYVTLAADSGECTNSGLFNEASIMQDEEPLGKHVGLDTCIPGSDGDWKCILYVSDQSKVLSNLDTRAALHDEDDEDDDDPDRMLVTRGWTLQEAILAPRVLHYTSMQLFWECPHRGYVAEDDFSVNLQYRRPTFTELKQRLQIVGPESQVEEVEETEAANDVGYAKDETEVLKAWYNELVEIQYTTRQLSYQTDKLPAIAGLASLAARSLRCAYIVGMWRTHLEWALTWRKIKEDVPVAVQEARTAAHDKQAAALQRLYRVPSFSWATSNARVSWDYAIPTFQRTAVVDDFHLELERDNPFGRVREGCWLRVSGNLSKQIIAFQVDGWNSYYFRSCGGISGKFHKDFDAAIPRAGEAAETGGEQEKPEPQATGKEQDEESYEMIFLELGFGSGAFPALQEQAGPMPQDICLLALAPIEGNPGCFTRIGFAEFSWDLAKKGRACELYQGLCEWQTVTIY